MQVGNREYLRTLKEKLAIFLINTFFLHIPLLALTHRQNYGETDRITEKQTELRRNELILVGLGNLQFLQVQRNKYTRCAWAGGTFFQLCCCVNFWFWREICFGFTYYYLCTQSTIQLWCCVSFLVLAGKLFLVLRTYLVYNTVVRLCSFLVVVGNSSQNENTFQQKNLIGLLYYDPLVSQNY